MDGDDLLKQLDYGKTIQVQNGVNCNILSELASIGPQSKELFEKILMELMINTIQKRLSFSDNLLIYCWEIESRSKEGALESALWKTIAYTCSYIIKRGSKTDWFWFKECLMASTIWYRKCPADDTGTYLYYELLELVDIEAQNQLHTLENDLNILASKSKDQHEWNKLIKWKTNTTQYPQARQDCVPNGIINTYSLTQLSASSNYSFNSPQFHDYNQYLSQLVLLAHMVDDEFHKSVQSIFGDVHDCKYSRGPVKLMERAKNKAEHDYIHESFPTSACVVDFNRCALVFNDIASLLQALELFVTRVKQSQSGNIIDIVRCKNGFIQYVQQTSYADIKLNVLIAGKQHNIIGEIQFLLTTMKLFKDGAHNLYTVQRKQEAMNHSVSKLLPMLLDQDKQLAIAGTTGNIKSICKLMVFYNKSSADLMRPDDGGGRNVLYRVCRNNQTKALLFFKSVLSRDAFVGNILSECDIDSSCIETTVWFSRTETFQYLFEMDEIRKKYERDEYMFRLLDHLFVGNESKEFIQFVLLLLNISKEKVQQMMLYQFPQSLVKEKPAHQWQRYAFVTRVISRTGTLDALQRCISVIGEASFVNKVVFHRDGWNLNAVECGIKFKRAQIVEYILSFKEVRSKYMKGDNTQLLYRLMCCLFAYATPNTISYVIKQLEISSSVMNGLMGYKYPEIIKKYEADAEEYHRSTIIAKTVCCNTLDAFKILMNIIGETVVCDAVFVKDGNDKNAIQHAIEQNKLEIMKYMLNIQEIKNKIMKDEKELNPIISHLNMYCNSNEEQVETAAYFVNEVNLSQTTLSTLQKAHNLDISAILKMMNVADK